MASEIDDDPVMPLAGQPHGEPRHRGSRSLRMTAIALDALSVCSAWIVAMALFGRDGSIMEIGTALAAATVAHWAAFERAGLHRSRVTSARLEEMTRVLRTVLAVAFAMYFLGRFVELWVPAPVAASAALLTLLLVFLERSILRAWLLSQRSAGRYCRSVVIVGANDEAAAMYDLLAQHPELGYDVVGVYGEPHEARRNGLQDLWCGNAQAASWRVHRDNITGAIVAASALDRSTLNRITRELLAVGAHVQLSSRLAGFASRRMVAQAIAYEPVIYLERLELARWQSFVKRALDVVVSLVLLVPASIVMAVFAVAVKMEDRGPAMFRQTRIGRDGKPFEVLKLRTMVVDAEAKLAALQGEANERGGPLFKMEDDPRFTRVGRLMDLTSINELPQLWNVLRGDMSIIGPRPSLPAEYAEFDPALQTRTVVRPGITGLWQVEARDNPSFDAYRRFDLHYVENWSVSLDVVILLATLEAVLSRLVRMARRTTTADHVEHRNPPRASTGPTSGVNHTGHPDRRRATDRRTRPNRLRADPNLAD